MREDTLHHLPSKAVNHTKPKLSVIPFTILVSCVLTFGCSTESKPVVEATPPAPAPSAAAPTEQPQAAAKVGPAEPNEVQAAVKRVFKDSAVVDSSLKPAFVTGDFNGDASQDLAVVLKPDATRVADLNEEFPSWILRDLNAKESGGPHLRIGTEEVLLAVIHGYGPNGWRDSQATQTFVLKNAAGSSMTAHSAKNFVAANKGRKMPALRGDVLAEVLGGKSGYLYYSGASYSWYDPKSFKGEPEPRRGHRSGMK